MPPATNPVPDLRPRLCGVVAGSLSAGADPERDRIGLAGLRQAYRLGVRRFEDGPASRAEAAEELFSLAFPAGADPPSLSVTLVLPSVLGPRRGESGEAFQTLRLALSRARARLGPRPMGTVWLDGPHVPPGLLGELRDDWASALAECAAPAWGVRFERDVPERGLLAEWVEAGARHFAFPLHLLNGRTSVPAANWVAESGGRVSALDVFAGGRLNGEALEDGRLGLAAGVPRPLDLDRWSRELAPVLRLGFLTEGKRRTLPEAALHFALATDGVDEAALPLGDPRRLETWCRADARSALTSEERERALASAILGDAGSGEPPGA